MSSMGRQLALRLQHARIKCKHRALWIYERRKLSIPCILIFINRERPLTKANPECLPSKLLLPSAYVCIIKNVNDFLSTANAKRMQSWWMHTFISMCAKQCRVVLTKMMIDMHKIDNLPIWIINLGPSSTMRKFINPTQCNAWNLKSINLVIVLLLSGGDRIHQQVSLMGERFIGIWHVFGQHIITG